MPNSRLLSVLIGFVLLFSVLAGHASAGGGPESVLLVVNKNDPGSMTVANYFIDARRIPAGNVLYVDWNLGDSYITIDQFRTELLVPIREFLQKRKLAGQIDYIIYSSGFPYGVRFNAEVPAALKTNPYFKYPTASTTGLTYLYGAALLRDATKYAAFNSNKYMRLRESRGGAILELPTEPSGQLRQNSGHRPLGDVSVAPSSVGSHGFRSWYGWGPKGELIEAGGPQYMLSTMLGVTHGRGNTLSEIVESIRRSVAADGTSPKGTIYFMDNADIRSSTRKPGFEMAAAQLRALGVNARVESGEVPQSRADVQGLLMGSANFDWRASGSVIRPGAICENLTSYSAMFNPKQGQTPCSEFIRYGASGTSGTVDEPYAQQNKFPHAMIQVHYARGCSLAEAFYQSVYSPYQLLVIGDPLCRPWANIPRITITGVSDGGVVKGEVTIQPSATLPSGGECDRFELFVDGLRLDTCAAGETLSFDSTLGADGYHEVRVVGIEKSPIETQGSAVFSLQFDNHNRTIEFTATPDRVVAGRPVKVSVRCPDAEGIAIYHNGQAISTLRAAQGNLEIDSNTLGDGPIVLTAIGWKGGKEYAISKPVKLFVQNGAGRR